MEKTIKVSTLKLNPNNPRIKKDESFEKLKKSISEFPKMLNLRPLIVDSENIVLGGNMRLQAIIDLGYNEIPESWVKKASELTEEEKQRFIIADNVNFGDWDIEALREEWDKQQLNDWGLDKKSNEIIEIAIENPTETTKDFKKEIDKIKDSNAKYPIVPEFLENYNAFIIITKNEIDETFIRNLFKIETPIYDNDKGLSIRNTNVIDVEQIKKALANDSNCSTK